MKTGVVVIDLQEGFLDSVIDSELLVYRVKDFLEKSCKKGFNVYCVVSPGGGKNVLEKFHFLNDYPGLVSLAKSRDSAFDATELKNLLESDGITRLVICGLYLESCVTKTAISASQIGLFEVMVPKDLVSFRNKGADSTELKFEEICPYGDPRDKISDFWVINSNNCLK